MRNRSTLNQNHEFASIMNDKSHYESLVNKKLKKLSAYVVEPSRGQRQLTRKGGGGGRQLTPLLKVFDQTAIDTCSSV